MSSRAPSPMALGDGGTRHDVSNGARSGRRGRGSSCRASNHRSTALRYPHQRVAMGMNQDMVRLRFDEFRRTATGDIHIRGNYNNNNQINAHHLGDDELHLQMDEFQGIVSEQTEVMRISHHEATRERYEKLHVPRIGSIPSPKHHGVF